MYTLSIPFKLMAPTYDRSAVLADLREAGAARVILGWFGGEYPGSVGFVDWLGLLLICFILPAAISLALGFLLRRLGWIKEGDLTLQ